MNISIRKLNSAMLSHNGIAAYLARSNRSVEYFRRILSEQERGDRVVLIALADGELAGHVTVKYRSDYPHFRETNTPEINDLWVNDECRRRGIAAALMDEAERIIFEHSPLAGLGVGLYADYGPAQQMYARRGYVPDGNGLYYGTSPVVPGSQVTVDDHLALFLVKERPAVND